MRGIRFLILFIVSFQLLNAVPEWFIKNQNLENYLFGRASVPFNKKNPDESQKNAINQALGELANKLICNVNSSIINKEQEIQKGKNTEHFIHFVNEVQVSSNLVLSQYEVMNSEIEGKYFYVQVGIEKDKLKEFYQTRISREIETLSQSYQTAINNLSGNLKTGLKQLEECRNLLILLEQEIAVLEVLVTKEEMTSITRNYPNFMEIDGIITQYSGNIIISMEEMSFVLTNFLKENNLWDSPFIIHPIDWNGTGFISEFSAAYYKYLQGIFPKKESSREEIHISGHLIPGTEGVYLQTQIKNGNKILYHTAWLNPVTCEKIGWEKLKPLRLAEKLNDRINLLDNLQKDNGLTVQLRTLEFGNEPALYHFDETPHLQFMTNQECYISLLYIEADGTKTALLQNYHLSNLQANEWIDLPYELIACEPAGIEQMLLQASTEPLPQFSVSKIKIGENAYKNVLSESLVETIALTRGIKIKQPEKKITECSYQWTIMP
jgi:hypothetical protein